MEIDEAHKSLLKGLGLSEEDFSRFDGKFVRYEWNPEKGVRLYDPYYLTSYQEYIGIDGWSAWSSENDTFQSDILKRSRKRLEQEDRKGVRPDTVSTAEGLKKKFPGK